MTEPSLSRQQFGQAKINKIKNKTNRTDTGVLLMQLNPIRLTIDKQKYTKIHSIANGSADKHGYVYLLHLFGCHEIERFIINFHIGFNLKRTEIEGR